MWVSPTWRAPPLSSSEWAHQVLNFLAVLACTVSLIVVLQYGGGAACFLASHCFLFCCREIKTGLRNAKETFPLLFILCDSAPDPMLALCYSIELQFMSWIGSFLIWLCAGMCVCVRACVSVCMWVGGWAHIENNSCRCAKVHHVTPVCVPPQLRLWIILR